MNINNNRIVLFSSENNSLIEKGVSVRHYNNSNKLVKKILQAFGFAVNVKVESKTYLVNTKSLVQYKLRFKEMEESPSVNLKDKAQLLNLLYEEHKKNGYYSKDVNEEKKKLVQYENKDVNSFFNTSKSNPFNLRSWYSKEVDEEETLI